jgi:hypothetical protein
VSDPNLLYLTNKIVELKWNTLYHRISSPMTKWMLRSQGIPSFCLILFQEHLRPRVRIMHRSLVTCICELLLQWGRTIKKNLSQFVHLLQILPHYYLINMYVTCSLHDQTNCSIHLVLNKYQAVCLINIYFTISYLLQTSRNVIGLKWTCGNCAYSIHGQ